MRGSGIENTGGGDGDCVGGKNIMAMVLWELHEPRAGQVILNRWTGEREMAPFCCELSDFLEGNLGGIVEEFGVSRPGWSQEEVGMVP